MTDKMGGTEGVGLIVYTGTREELCRKLRERDDEITRLRAAIDTSIGDLLHGEIDDAYVVLVGSRQPPPLPFHTDH